MLAATIALASTNIALADGCAHEQDELPNYVYTKFGIARTQYKKFKEVGSYFKKAPNVAPMFNLGLGRKLTKHFRAELNLQYGKLLYKASRDDENLKQKIHLYGGVFNAYYDIMPEKKINLYATGGLGIGINKNKDLKYRYFGDSANVKHKNVSSFIWNIGAGFRTDLNKRFSLDIGYRYIYLGKAKVIDTPQTSVPVVHKGATQKIYGHQMLAAISYNF